ncbi:MAG: ABC transporter ATP-binding protein [Candidatus Dadabacteria bacterium]|nr:MAG: ABC transporter ATP-binding protein [Candidatus Dadabacteria bacterium]
MAETAPATTAESIAPPNPDAAISVRDLHKWFGSHHVLKGMNFDIPKGEITVFIGPSGTGKSVLMKTMVGLLRPSRGEVWYGNTNIHKLRGKQLYELRATFGKLFQDAALFDSLSVYENVAFPLHRHTDYPEEKIRDIVAEKLRQVGLPGVEHKMPGELSGGMRKRVGLARAIALDPEIVFFDEPNSGLDPVMSAAIDELILETKELTGATFVVISHDIEGTFKIADNIGMLYMGELIQFGTQEEIRSADNPILRQFFERRTEGPIAIA